MNNHVMGLVRVEVMSDALQEQFKRCQEWNDSGQWQALGVLYHQKGYDLNALYCFKKADACRVGQRVPVAMETES